MRRQSRKNDDYKFSRGAARTRTDNHPASDSKDLARKRANGIISTPRTAGRELRDLRASA